MSKKKPEPKIIDSKQLSLEQWMDAISKPDGRTYFPPLCSFPTLEHRKQFVSRINDFEKQTFDDVLRSFIIRNGSLGIDKIAYQYMYTLDKDEFVSKVEQNEFVKRLISQANPWEGITWIIDALESNARKVIDVIELYLQVHFPFLPDYRIYGLDDAIEIIRARHLNKEHPRETLLNMEATQFEGIIAQAYTAMGYNTMLTKTSHDGGVDVIADRSSIGNKEKILIQCKKYENTVGVDPVRCLLGVITECKATKGVLICSSTFSKSAIRFASGIHQIELINWKGTIHLLNSYLGSEWPITYHRIARKSIELHGANTLAKKISLNPLPPGL